MEKGIINKKAMALGILGITVVAYFTFFLQNKPTTAPVIQPTIIIQKQIPNPNITYQGESGKDALAILKEKANIELDKSGLVISINGRKSDNAKREYWAFYVNGKSAPVGPADYQTQNTDTIQWKIEKY